MPIDIPSYLLGKKSGGGGGGGTSDYDSLENKPQINGVTLSGNKTAEDLGIEAGYPGVFVVQLDQMFGIDYSKNNITVTLNADERPKFLDVIQYYVDNPGKTTVLLIKSNRVANSHDAQPAFWLRTDAYYASGNNSVSFYNMSLVHPRNSPYNGKIADVHLSISFTVSDGEVTEITNVTISKGADVLLEDTANKVTSISSSSTDTQYPSAKCVYNAIPNITYGTTDLTPGVSELAEGTFYFYFE